MKVELTHSKQKIVLIAVGCLVFAVMCLFLLGENPIIALIGLVFFGGVGLYSLTKQWETPGTVTLEDHGLRPSSGGFVPWQDIEFVGLGRMKGAKMLGVRLSSTQAFAESLTPEQFRLMQRVARVAGFVGGAMAYASPDNASDAMEIVGIPRESVDKMIAWSRQKTGLDLAWSPFNFAGSAEEVVNRIETYRQAALTR